MFGLPWCSNEPKRIGIESATSRVLCRKHNEQLSLLDEEASRLARFMELSVFDDPLSHSGIQIDGPRFERWALKTFCNFSYLGALDSVYGRRTLPPRFIVEHLFRAGPLPNGAGLYFLGGALSTSNYRAGFGWRGIHQRIEETPSVGMFFTFHEMRFVVTIAEGNAEQRIRKLGIVDDLDLSSCTITYRPGSIRFSSETAASKTITLNWGTQPRALD